MDFIKVQRQDYEVSIRRPEIGTLAEHPCSKMLLRTTSKEPLIVTEPTGEEHVASLDLVLKTCCISRVLLECMGAKPFKVDRLKDTHTYWAKLVPLHRGKFDGVDYFGVPVKGNGEGIDHGWGDVIVAPDYDGKPWEHGQFVVNGRLFLTAYKAVIEG